MQVEHDKILHCVAAKARKTSFSRSLLHIDSQAPALDNRIDGIAGSGTVTPYTEDLAVLGRSGIVPLAPLPIYTIATISRVSREQGSLGRQGSRAARARLTAGPHESRLWKASVDHFRITAKAHRRFSPSARSVHQAICRQSELRAISKDLELGYVSRHSSPQCTHFNKIHNKN